MFNDRPETRAVMEWFSRGEHLKTWLASGGTIAPQKDAETDWYGNEIDRVSPRSSPMRPASVSMART